MRQVRLRSLLASVLLVTVLAGCTGGGKDSKGEDPNKNGGAQTGQTEKPKALTIAAGTTAVSMDVQRVTDSPTFTVLEHIYETLFSMTEKGEIKPLLAEDFKANEDGKSYTITLKSGVKFSDGTPFNAEAVKKNLERVLNKDSKATYRSLIDQIEAIEVKGDTTVVIKTKQPFAPIQFHLTHVGVAMIAPSALEKGNDWLASNAIGTGPYKLKEYKKDQHVTLEKNPDYWGTKAIINEVTFKAVKEDGPRILEAESGTTDVAMRIPASEVARLKANKDIEVHEDPSLRMIYIYFNQMKAPFNDKRVRQAINYAVDKESIVKNLLGGAGLVADAPMASPVFGYSKQTPYARNVEKAKALLKDAGVAPGTKITLHHPNGRYAQDAKIAEAVAVQLKEIGLEVELKTLEWAQYLEYTNKPSKENQVNMALLGWATSTMDGDYALYNMFHSSQWTDNGGFNRAFYKNDEVDRLLDSARTTVDPAKRKDAYAQAIKILWDDAPWLWLHVETQITAVRKNVTGLTIHPSERLIWRQADKK